MELDSLLLIRTDYNNRTKKIRCVTLKITLILYEYVLLDTTMYKNQNMKKLFNKPNTNNKML